MKLFRRSALLVLCLSTLPALANAVLTPISIPNCYDRPIETEDLGSYAITLKLAGRTAEDTARFIEALTRDPIWPSDTILANEVDGNGKHLYLNAVVAPNINRFPPGTKLADTRSAVEKTIRRIQQMPGVTIHCVNAHGD